jgi:single-stranded-DNA-specific exonuclease
MKSYKGKQDRSRDKAVKLLLEKASDYENDKVAIIDATEEIDGPLTGLVAIKISESIHKPVLLVRKHEGSLSGSGRAFNNCPIEDFRYLVEECPYTDWAHGHGAAFGCQLPADNIDNARVWFNDNLKDINMDKVYHVDFITDVDDLSINFIQTIDQYQDLWGHGLSEPLIAIENITIKRSDIQIQGKNFDSVAFTINDIKFVEFKMEEDNKLLQWVSAWDGDKSDEITLNIVGEVSLNEYKGVYTPQVIIKESMITNGLD